jgi:hypothetical protein
VRRGEGKGQGLSFPVFSVTLEGTDETIRLRRRIRCRITWDDGRQPFEQKAAQDRESCVAALLKLGWGRLCCGCIWD